MDQVSFGISSCLVDCADGIAHAAIVGEVDFVSAPQLSKILDQLEASVLVLDLSAVTFIDASGLHLLSRLRTRFGPGLSLAAPSNAVLRLMDVTKMTSQFRCVV